MRFGGSVAVPVRSSALRAGNRVGYFGDSHVDGAGASNAAFSFRNVTSVLTGAFVAAKDSINGGVPGQTSAQVLARVRQFLAQNPDVGVLLVGTNDAGAGVPVAEYAANIVAIHRAFAEEGVPLIICTVPPRLTNATAALVNAYNLWLRSWAPTVGVLLADFWASVVDPVTGLMAAMYNSNDGTGVHVNDAGHVRFATTLAPLLTSLAVPVPWPVKATGVGMLSDPLQLENNQWNGARWDVLANYLADMTVSTVADASGSLPAGRWTHFDHNNTSGSAKNTVFRQVLPTSKWSAGDELAAFVYVRASSASMLSKIGFANLDTGAFTSVGLDTPPVATPGPVAFKWKVPTSGGPTNLGLAVAMSTGPASWLEVGACDVLNLTKMGVSLSI